MRIRHYWRNRVQSREGDRFSLPVCDAAGTLKKLSRQPEPPLSWFDRVVAFLTTPFKYLGIHGWQETGCAAEGQGSPVREAQHSTDGFWTIDLSLDAVWIGGAPAILSGPRFLRLEVEPGTAAHEVCGSNRIGPRRLWNSGAPWSWTWTDRFWRFIRAGTFV